MDGRVILFLRRVIERERQDSEVGLHISVLLYDREIAVVEEHLVVREHIFDIVARVIDRIRDRAIADEPHELRYHVDVALAVQGELDLAVVVYRADTSAAGIQSREHTVLPDAHSVQIVLGHLGVAVKVDRDLTRHRNKVIHRPGLVFDHLIRIVHLVLLDELFVEENAVGAVVVKRRDVSGREIHLALHRKILVCLLIPPFLGEVEIRDFRVQIEQVSLARKRAYVVCTDHRGVIFGVPGHDRLDYRLRAVAVSTARLAADVDLVYLYVIAILDDRVPTVDGVVHSVAVLALCEEVIGLRPLVRPVSGDKDVECLSVVGLPSDSGRRARRLDRFGFGALAVV